MASNANDEPKLHWLVIEGLGQCAMRYCIFSLHVQTIPDNAVSMHSENVELAHAQKNHPY